MKRIQKCGMILLAVVVGSLISCQQNQPIVDEKLKDVKVGPPMQQVQNVNIKVDSLPVPKTLPNAGTFNFFVLDGRTEYQGEIRALNGRVDLKENILHFSPSDGKPLDIRLDLPEGLSLAKMEQGDATLRLRNLSGPEGADQFLSLETKEHLLIGSTWHIQANPFSLDLGKGIKIIQESLGEVARQKAGYTTAKCYVTGLGGRIELTPGKATDITLGKATYTCLLEISSYFKPNDPGEDGREGYILKSTVMLKSVK